MLRAVRLGVIDIGTNTLLLLVAERCADGQIRAVTDVCRFGRLGQGLDATGRLHPDAIARSLVILREYRSLLDHHGVSRTRVIATEAMREAENASELVGPAASVLGTNIETIDGPREAELAYLAQTHSLPRLQGKPFVVADVGGGSTEIVVADGTKVASATSVPIGAVRLAERHLTSDPPSSAEKAALAKDIDAALAPLALPSGVTLVASAGTATNLAAADLALERYDSDRVHGHTMTPAALGKLADRLLAATAAQRREIVGIEAQRADVIPAGAAIFQRLVAKLAATEVVVSDRGIRWGVAYEQLLR
jgi:exopolyphosphatase/guanosine-5'-triphosphate,3'-diphosphate pyrophosphatase